MSDILNAPHAERFVDPDEPGLACAYTFGEGELAQFGRYLNRARTGAAYDLTTRVGTPLVGQGGGVYCRDTSSWGNAIPVPTGNSYPSYAIELEHGTLLAGAAWLFMNGSVAAHGITRIGNLLYVSFDGATTVLVPDCSSRGPYRIGFSRSSATGNQTTTVNGRLVSTTAMPVVAPAGGVIIGRDGTIRKVKMSIDPTWSVASERASYVREFAKRVVYQWTPRDVGEGPAGGIATGATGDTWNCILGDATLKFVWMTEPRLRQKQLALTGVNNQSPCRLEFPHTRMPSFGTWRWGMVARSLAATPEVYLAQLPRQTHAAAGSGCYWGRIAVTGGYWTVTWYCENGAAMLTRINTSAAAALGDIVEAAVSRAVDGTWRADVGVNGNWANQGVNAANDVTYLSSNFVGVQPNSGHVLGVVRYQGEMTPGEFPRSDWYAPSLWSLVW